MHIGAECEIRTREGKIPRAFQARAIPGYATSAIPPQTLGGFHNDVCFNFLIQSATIKPTTSDVKAAPLWLRGIASPW